MITKELFFSALPLAPEEYYEPTARWMEKLGIDTPVREDMFLAQLGHEADKGNAFEEYASGDAYEYRTDLGNTPVDDDDGPKYKGRGGIMCTGKHNYTELTKYAQSLGYDVDFVKNPELVSLPEWSGLASAWYWTQGAPKIYGNLNQYADRGDLKTSTKAINGGLNGWDDRLRIWRLMQAIRAGGGRPALKQGDIGWWVKKLQKMLGIRADGAFGPGTRASVIQFQTQNALVADGVVGAKTWDALEGDRS